MFSSCGGNDADYGVLLWQSRELPFETGAVVRYEPPPVRSRQITVHALDGDAAATVRRGFMKHFDSLEQAKRFRNRYNGYRDMFAVAARRSVPLREQPSQGSDVLQRLEESERVKVVQRHGNGDWYEVVSDDANRGYAREAQLSFPQRTGIQTAETMSAGSDSLESFFETTWRPAYMREMVSAPRVNLRRFDPNIGLFPNEERIVVGTGKSRLRFDIEEPQAIGGRVYSFAGGDLQVRFLSGDEIVVRYEHHGTAVRERYVRLNVDMRQVIEDERERRSRIFAQLRAAGDRFQSEHYGTMEIDENRTLRWTSREALQPEIIPRDAAPAARMRLNVFLGDELRDEYDGAFTLLFDLGQRNKELAFAYRLLRGGIQLTLVPIEHVRDDFIQSIPSSPTVMFFSAIEQANNAGASSSSG